MLRRSVRGIRMAVNMPVKAYRGVAIRLDGEGGQPPDGTADGGTAARGPVPS